MKCMSLVAPGPHVFLLVICISKFTKEEKETLEQIKNVFGKDSEKFSIVLFTGGENLGDGSVEEHIEFCGESLKKLISDCGGRYQVFNNRDKENRVQVRELIRKIDTMVKENGERFYTNEMLQKAEAAL